VTSTNLGGPNQGAAQTSSAYYLQNVTSLTSNISLTLGGREQRMKQRAQQDAYAAWFSPAMNGESTRTRSAYDFGLAYAGDNWRAYGKTGTTFRFANTDELFGSDAFGAPIFAGDLKPQHGTTSEVGGNITIGPVGMRASLYQLDLSDEIGYDSALFSNVNLAPTRRTGGEAEFDWKITGSLTAKLAYAQINAHFRAGSYAGKALPLVPHEQTSLQMLWNSGRTGQYSALIHHVGERPYGSDFANAKNTLSGYTTVDLQGGWDMKPFRVTAKLMNAFDRKYSPFAGYSAFRNDYYYYPADGRALYISGRYDF
jgi:iron complex outermembrane receptor protein